MSSTLNLSDLEAVLDERFEGLDLDPAVWLPFYLPHWAGRDRSRAWYRLEHGHLELFIGDDQREWLPPIALVLRVSSLQTGAYSGAVGPTIGQHRTDEAMRVVEEQVTQRLVLPHFGAVEVRACWDPHPHYMVAFWMIGFEEDPEHSGEICVSEIFGSEASTGSALVGAGIHPFNDSTLVDDFEKVRADIDIRKTHTYAAVWNPSDVTFYIDGRETKRSNQSPDYPMQLMVGIYHVGDSADSTPTEPVIIERVRVLAPKGD